MIARQLLQVHRLDDVNAMLKEKDQVYGQTAESNARCEPLIGKGVRAGHRHVLLGQPACRRIVWARNPAVKAQESRRVMESVYRPTGPNQDGVTFPDLHVLPLAGRLQFDGTDTMTRLEREPADGRSRVQEQPATEDRIDRLDAVCAKPATDGRFRRVDAAVQQAVLRDMAKRIDVGARVAAHRDQFVGARETVVADEIPVPSVQGHSKRRVRRARRRHRFEGLRKIVNTSASSEIQEVKTGCIRWPRGHEAVSAG
jgi:hypothetical protein